MNTDVTTDAASSAAESPTPIAVEDFTSEQRDTWLSTGELPAKQIEPLSDKSATSKPGEVSEKDTDAKSAESGTAPKEKSTKDSNWRTLEADRNRERERAEKAEARLKELEAGSKSDVKEADSSSVVMEKPAAPVKPKRADFETDELYEKAYEDEYLPKKQAFDAATKAFETQMEAINGRHKSLTEKWKGIKTEGEKLYGAEEWKKAADAFEAHSIYSGDPFEVYVRESTPELGAHFMQYMSLKPKDVERIVKLPVGEQWKELNAIETAMREELKLNGEPPPVADAEKSATADKPKAKVVSDALPPPREVGGKGTASEDEEAEALRKSANGNPKPYMDLMNRRELEKRKSARR